MLQQRLSCVGTCSWMLSWVCLNQFVEQCSRFCMTCGCIHPTKCMHHRSQFVWATYPFYAMGRVKICCPVDGIVNLFLAAKEISEISRLHVFIAMGSKDLPSICWLWAESTSNGSIWKWMLSQLRWWPRQKRTFFIKSSAFLQEVRPCGWIHWNREMASLLSLFPCF